MRRTKPSDAFSYLMMLSSKDYQAQFIKAGMGEKEVKSYIKFRKRVYIKLMLLCWFTPKSAFTEKKWSLAEEEMTGGY